MIKYEKLDSFPSNHPNYEVSRHGEVVTDIHSVCTLQTIKLEGDALTLKFKVTWEKDPVGTLPLGETCSLVFSKAKITKLNIDGVGKDDLGSFDAVITLPDELGDTVIVSVASSIELWVDCTSIRMDLSTD